MSPAEKAALAEAERLPKALRREFDMMVKSGNTPQFAMMCLHQKAPNAGQTDQAFNRSARFRMNDMDDKQRDDIVRIARRAGIDTNGKYYCGRIGKYNDPDAWCSTVDDVKAACRKKNLDCDGVVKHKAAPVAPFRGPDLAPDIADGLVKKRLMKDEQLAAHVKEGKKKIAEVREEVVAKHGRKRRVYGG